MSLPAIQSSATPELIDFFFLFQGYKDNPKINAIALIKGTPQGKVPRIASLIWVAFRNTLE